MSMVPSHPICQGTRAVLPAGTEVEVNITESGTAIVDFSNEFATYAPEDEQGILEAITWTLTQFDTINDVVIWINGHPQDRCQSITRLLLKS